MVADKQDYCTEANILIVDDNVNNLKVLCELLQSNGYNIRPASSGETALELIAEARPQLVLLDIKMPVMDGYEVCRRIKSNEDTAGIPVIFVSAMNVVEDKVKAFQFGGVDYITKPLEFNEVLARVKNQLDLFYVRQLLEVSNLALEASHKQLEVRIQERTQELSKSEERFQLAMKGANDGLWDWNIKTGELYLSPRWMQMLGYQEGIFDRQFDRQFDSWIELLHPDDLNRVKCLFNRYSKGGKERLETEYRMRHRSGDYIDILSRAFSVSENNKPVRLVGTHVDISEHKQSERALRQSQEQLSALSRHLQEVREEEKANIAQEVHDELGATLTALNMDIHWLEGNLAQAQLEMHAKVHDMSQLVDAATEACRRIVTELHPSVLVDLGLMAAIEWQASEFSQRLGIPCEVSTNLKHLDITDDKGIAVFRIFQEALTNIARHAKAGRVDVILLCADSMLRLQIVDDGIGLPIAQGEKCNGDKVSSRNLDRRGEQRRAPAFNLGSFGVRGMGERASYLGGTLRLESEPGMGTRVVLSLPL